jgi:hypothetical protein
LGRAGLSVMKPIIAIIVSDKRDYCKDFLKFHKLNPNLFKIATEIEDLRGIDINMPIIITYCKRPLFEIGDFIKDRFKSVRFMDY